MASGRPSAPPAKIVNYSITFQSGTVLTLHTIVPVRYRSLQRKVGLTHSTRRNQRPTNDWIGNHWKRWLFVSGKVICEFGIWAWELSLHGQPNQTHNMWFRHILRPALNSASRQSGSRVPPAFASSQRYVRHQAFDASLDPDELAEARKWHRSFQISQLPQGNTSFSRSSGPGGQHVNKFVSLFPCTANLG